MYEEDEVEIPIYLITGFLESGKTSFINFTVAQDYFQIDGPTKAGIQQEIRKREHYEKPSVRRKKKSEAARKRKYN